MSLYIGDIYIPFVHVFEPDKGSKQLKPIKHVDKTIPPVMAEFEADLRNFTIEGTLMTPSGTVKTADQYAEDVDAIRQRTTGYNFIDTIVSRTGWMSVRDSDTPLNADSPLVRSMLLGGLFFPKSRYITRMHTSPKIRSNPFSFTLGVDDCDNYIAIPIGATYSGGDGSTITRTGEDGTITLVLATSATDIKFDVAEDDVDNGEVQIWDELGEASESDWIKIFNRDHSFEGDAVIQNSLYRVRLDSATEYITIYRWNSTVWTKIDDFTCGTFTEVHITKANPDEVICKLSSGVEITMRRGHPLLIDTGTDDLVCISLTPADQTTTSENYLVLATSTYICSDAIFSIVNSTKNLDDGKKWIFYETVSATAEDIAHQAMVNPNFHRELVGR